MVLNTSFELEISFPNLIVLFLRFHFEDCKLIEKNEIYKI